jgi:hypothetical protein
MADVNLSLGSLTALDIRYQILQLSTHCLPADYLSTSNGVGVGVLLATDSQSTSTCGYRASLWDP